MTRARAAWARLRPHAAVFGRLFLVTLAGSGAVDSILAGSATRATITAAVVGAAEVAYRKAFPVK